MSNVWIISLRKWKKNGVGQYTIKNIFCWIRRWHSLSPQVCWWHFFYQRTDVYPFTARGLRSLDVKMKVVWDTIYKLKCFSALERWYPIVMLMTQIMFAFSNLFHNIIQHLRKAISGNFVALSRIHVLFHFITQTPVKYQDFSFYQKIIFSSHTVKMLFLSFICEDIGVAIVTKMITIVMVT